MSYVTTRQFKEFLNHLLKIINDSFEYFEQTEKCSYKPEVKVFQLKNTEIQLMNSLKNKYMEMIKEIENDTGKKFECGTHNWGDVDRYATEDDLKELKKSVEKEVCFLSAIYRNYLHDALC